MTGHSDDSRTPTRGSEDFELTNDAGEVVQIARFRADGSLLLTDRQDVDTPGSRGGRRLTLYSRNGVPVGQWRTAKAFYQQWLKMVVGKKKSIVVSDSAFVGGMMHSFSSPHASLVHALHSHHQNETRRTTGLLVERNFLVLSNADNFDRLAILTKRQRDDLIRDNIGSDNLVAIPNPFHGEPIRSIKPRRRERGVTVARLSGIKRLDHAVQALAATTHPTPPTLDIYGEGNDRRQIENKIAELGLNESVRLHGHDAKAREQFATSSFSLLTSRSEGQSLMLIESMASGCIPIAYDIDYGPSDIITNGVDGFLVTAGDPLALAGALSRFLKMDEEDVMAMRAAAVETSKRFSAEAVTARWGKVFYELTSAPPAPRRGVTANVSAQLVAAEVTDGNIELSIRLEIGETEEASWAKLTWIGRRKDVYLRAAMRQSQSDGYLLFTGTLPVDQLILGPSGFLDLFVDARVGGTRLRKRVAVEPTVTPVAFGDLELYATAHGNASIRRLANPATRPV
ncbi:glycosyltransferase [Brevibacterium yomogidense]|uniref:glycosyltransferase n=1 Tax=Brevibacterium yomogidense TaxID=946573 RepID=UPI0018E01259|nr:glycosyltransferase [Brevibacterium yomogidense]